MSTALDSGTRVGPAWPWAGTGPGADGVEDALAAVLPTVRASAAEDDAQERFPTAALAALRSSGLLGLLVPRADGGPGGTVEQVLRVTRELARESTSVGMIYVMHCQQVAALVRFAAPDLGATLLPAVARGEVYLGSVTTGATTGGSLLASASPLVSDAGSLRVDRFAPIVTGGAHADGFLISMQAPGATSPHQVSLVYAGRGQLRITPEGSFQALGMRATQSIALRLDGEVPADHVLGEHGGFREIALKILAPFAHLGWASCWLGAADGALRRTVRLLRTQRDRIDLTAEPLLHRLSRARQRLDTVHALVEHTRAVLADHDGDLSRPPVQLLLNAVKLTASEQCPAAVDELIEAVGMRHGYLRDSPLALERVYRDLRSASLNYANDRLHSADGALVLADKDVRRV